MKTSVYLVAISRDDASELFTEDQLFLTLTNQIDSLEIESGITISEPASDEPKEAPGPAYSVYQAAATYKGSIEKLREEVKELGLENFGGYNINFVPQDLRNEDKKLLIMDVDSTLIRQEVIDELASFAGRSAEVAQVTERAMRGELDFSESLRERVATLSGQPESILTDVQSRIFYTAGARTLISAFLKKGHIVAVVSGGFVQVLEPIASDLHLSYARANLLETADGKLTGQVLGTIIDSKMKNESLKEWSKAEKISSDQIIAVGDGANDILMANEAELGVAFNAKPALAEVADARINTLRLDAVRYFVGI